MAILACAIDGPMEGATEGALGTGCGRGGRSHPAER